MQYARLGSSGLVVSRLALGTMTFGDPQQGKAALLKVDQKKARELVAQAMDAGVNLFDTADVYASGQSEEMLGEALGARRKDVIVSTKIGNRLSADLLKSGLSRRHIISATEECLRRLKTDWIDVLFCHKYDANCPVDETLSALDHLVREGKVRYTGFSNWPAWRAASALERQRSRGYDGFAAAQVYYSLVGRELENEVLPFCNEQGVGTVVWSPLAGGYLTGRYTEEDPSGNGGRLQSFDHIPVNREQGKAILSVLKRISEENGRTQAQIALAWLLARPISSVIVGVSSAQQLESNLAASDIRLSSTELGALDEVSRIALPYPQWCDHALTDRELTAAIRSPYAADNDGGS